MGFQSWDWAVDAVARFLVRPARLQHLLEGLPQGWGPGERRRSQSLLFGTVRHLSLLEKALSEFLRRPPRPGVKAALLVAGYELLDEPEKRPLVVNHAVGRIGARYSKGERSMANAVLRKMGESLAELTASMATDIVSLAWRYSHPEWLVSRWVEILGRDQAERILRWNQREPKVFVVPTGNVEPAELPFLESSNWPGYWCLSGSAWGRLEPFLEQGAFYVQDPAASVAPGILAELSGGGRVLDLCSAPGGKAIALERLLGSRLAGLLAVDLPGPRFTRLQENLALRRSAAECLAADIETLAPDKIGWFDAVLLDAPCSNSGVMQRKIDVKWRLDPLQFEELPKLQRRLLCRAADFVEPGGLLVYSLCSFDPAEGREVVDGLLGSETGQVFSELSAKTVLPGERESDGVAVFALRKAD